MNLFELQGDLASELFGQNKTMEEGHKYIVSVIGEWNGKDLVVDRVWPDERGPFVLVSGDSFSEVIGVQEVLEEDDE